MDKKDLLHKFSDFLVRNKKVDKIRNENFVKRFPEFRDFYGADESVS